MKRVKRVLIACAIGATSFTAQAGGSTQWLSDDYTPVPGHHHHPEDGSFLDWVGIAHAIGLF